MTNKDKLFAVLKENLRVFDQVCKKHNLIYYIIAGTLLGAVRHKGFIPWDDDIDVCMPRKDYNHLMELGNSVFDAPYFFQSPITDKGYQKTFCRLRNSNTTEIPIKDALFDRNHGAFIDIFPLDVIPDDRSEFEQYVTQLRMRANLLWFVGKVECEIGTVGLKLGQKIAYYSLLPACKLGFINRKKIFILYNKLCMKYMNTDNKEWGLVSTFFDVRRFIYEREFFEKGTIELPFDDIVVKAPKEWDAILTKCYGDYMIPVNQSSEHGDTVFNMDVPYAEYYIKNKDDLKKLWIEYKLNDSNA